MNPVLLDFGIIKIYWYSIMILLGVIIGGKIIIEESKKLKFPENFMTNFLFYLIPIAIIGARLYYVVFNLDYYMQSPIEILKVWEGGLAIHGGIIFGILWVIIYSKKYKIRPMRLMDVMTVGLIIGQCIGRWGNFFNQEAHGPAVTLEFLTNLHLPKFIIDGMNIGGIYYQPTFLYESLWCFIGFIILLIIRRIKYIKIGQITSFYFIWYGIGRFFIESLRTDSLLLVNFKIAQIISVVMVILGIAIFIIMGRGSKFDNKYNDRTDLENVKF